MAFAEATSTLYDDTLLMLINVIVTVFELCGDTTNYKASVHELSIIVTSLLSSSIHSLSSPQTQRKILTNTVAYGNIV